MPDDLELLHVPPADFKIRCATHLMHSGMLGLLRYWCRGPRRHREGSTLCCPPAMGEALIDGCLPVAVMVGEDAR
jgi:hypothetical protein